MQLAAVGDDIRRSANQHHRLVDRAAGGIRGGHLPAGSIDLVQLTVRAAGEEKPTGGVVSRGGVEGWAGETPGLRAAGLVERKQAHRAGGGVQVGAAGDRVGVGRGVVNMAARAAVGIRSVKRPGQSPRGLRLFGSVTGTLCVVAFLGPFVAGGGGDRRDFTQRVIENGICCRARRRQGSPQDRGCDQQDGDYVFHNRAR